MLARLKNLLTYWPPLLLCFITLTLAFLNYEPNTFLTGWDNLHLEFDPHLNLKRALNTTWQEYQSLGLLGGMGHGAALLESLIIWLLTLFTPISLIRYFWHFFGLILGPLGVYFFAYSTLLSFPRLDRQTKKVAAFFAGLFYLLNLATLQNFYIPFEPFSWFYAFLPWLLLVSIQYLSKPNRKHFLLLTLTFLLAAPAFYVQTIFVVFLLCLLPFLFYFFFQKPLPTIFLALTLFLTQAYWLLPVIYFTLNSSSTTINSLQNQISTPEIILRNQEFGGLKDVSLLKGFAFDYSDLNQNNEFEIMMGPWVDHLHNPLIKLIGYSFFILILVGLFYSFKRRLPYTLPLTGVFLLSLFFLINLNPPTGIIFRLLQEHIPLLNQFFRSVFTKWSIPAAFSYSLFFSVGVIFLLDIFSFLHSSLTTYLTSFSLALLLLLFSSPMFQGHLIYPAMRQHIPPAYFELFNYLKTQDPNTRIMNLPQPTLWGWQFYNWGYRGSGFLWYGIEQPILDRAFDVWSKASKTYYQELTTALYSQNLTLFENLLEKYQINWILLDSSIIIPGSDNQQALYLPQIQSLLDQTNKVKSQQTFDHLTLYELSLKTDPQDFINSHPYTPTPVFLPTPSLDSTSFHFVNTPNNNRSTITEPSNCDFFNQTFVDRQLTPDSVTYTAINANSCDHFTFPELSHSFGYRFTIEHQNLSGLPLLVCLESYASKTCLEYRYLTQDSDWHTDTLILPPMNPQDFGYTLHLYNYSIGQNPTINAWRQIEITPVSPQNFNLTPPPTSSPYTQILETHHPSYSLYTLSVNSSSPDSIFTLNQAFDPGWKAYFIFKNATHLPTSFLYFLSSLLIPLPEAHHLKVNDWSNAWLLPQGQSHLLLVYQPQLFQHLGFLLLIFLPPLYFLQRSQDSHH